MNFIEKIGFVGLALVAFGNTVALKAHESRIKNLENYVSKNTKIDKDKISEYEDMLGSAYEEDDCE